MFKKLAIIVALPVVLILSGCSIGAVSTPDPAASSATSAEVEAPVENPLVTTFGEVITYQDGISVSVSAPSAYAPSPYAAGVTVGFSVIQVTMVVTNNSAETLSIAGYPSATSASEQASVVTDLGNSVGDTPFIDLLPGQSIKWVEAYSVKDATKLTVQYSPDFLHDNSIFTNEV